MNKNGKKMPLHVSGQEDASNMQNTQYSDRIFFNILDDILYILTGLDFTYKNIRTFFYSTPALPACICSTL